MEKNRRIEILEADDVPFGVDGRRFEGGLAQVAGGILLEEMLVEPLSEFQNVRQIRGQGFRRWFVNSYFDLIVWYYDNKSSLAGFQLCYDRDGTQRALTWTVREGFFHTRIDSGDDVFARGLKMTPILVADGKFDAQTIHDLFSQASTTVDRAVADFVCTKLKECPLTI